MKGGREGQEEGPLFLRKRCQTKMSPIASSRASHKDGMSGKKKNVTPKRELRGEWGEGHRKGKNQRIPRSEKAEVVSSCLEISNNNTVLL